MLEVYTLRKEIRQLSSQTGVSAPVLGVELEQVVLQTQVSEGHLPEETAGSCDGISLMKSSWNCALKSPYIFIRKCVYSTDTVSTYYMHTYMHAYVHTLSLSLSLSLCQIPSLKENTLRAQRRTGSTSGCMNKGKHRPGPRLPGLMGTKSHIPVCLWNQCHRHRPSIIICFLCLLF